MSESNESDDEETAGHPRSTSLPLSSEQQSSARLQQHHDGRTLSFQSILHFQSSVDLRQTSSSLSSRLFLLDLRLSIARPPNLC